MISIVEFLKLLYKTYRNEAVEKRLFFVIPAPDGTRGQAPAGIHNFDEEIDSSSLLSQGQASLE